MSFPTHLRSIPARRRPLRLLRMCAGLALVACWLPSIQAQRTAAELTKLSLEELMQVEVTSVSKHAEKLGSAPAAVFVLTNDDLRRSGALNLPEALRLVPGVQVARVDAHDWAISARGFADVFANKLLVLRDGRSLYTPLFSGVFWDAQDTLLEDVDRIEVVRGPGATLWGANAVNGVINILTKTSSETQGLLASVTAGADPEARAAVRYGGVINANTHYRVYGKYTRSAASELPGNAGKAFDATKVGLGGFRIDHAEPSGELITLQGEAYDGREQQVFYVPQRTAPFVAALAGEPTFSGAHLLGRWTEHTSEGGEWMTQAYYDYTRRKTPVFDDSRRIFDFELQRRLVLSDRQEVTAGGGFRWMSDSVRNTETIALNPPSTQVNLWSAFIQDDLALDPHRWHLVLGTKFEHNDYTGLEVQPGARLLWTPDDHRTVWASVARAVRTPSRADEDILLREITNTPGLSVDVRGNHAVNSEVLVAYEAGFRYRLQEKISFDVAGFYNDYSRLRSTEVDPVSLPLLLRLANPLLLPPPPPAVLETHAADLLRGETHGGEIAVNTQLAPSWRLRTSFSLLRMNLHWRPGSTDTATPATTAGRNPRHQAMLWSQHDFGGGWQFDWRLRFTDRLPAIHVSRVIEADARLAWHPAENWEISLAGQNLLSPDHLEYLPTSVITPVTEVPRRAYLELSYGY